MASITGAPEAIADFVTAAHLPSQAEVLGPVPIEAVAGRPATAQDETQERTLIRIGRGDGLALARALHAAQATRSARKDGGVIRVQLDPAEVA
jgi:primosomal protein N' (replication factor Y)